MGESGVEAQKDSSEKLVEIIVNGRERQVEKGELSFADVVALAFETPPSGPNVIFTVTYKRGENPKTEGTMVAGDVVKVKKGMIFNVTATDLS